MLAVGRGTGLPVDAAGLSVPAGKGEEGGVGMGSGAGTALTERGAKVGEESLAAGRAERGSGMNELPSAGGLGGVGNVVAGAGAAGPGKGAGVAGAIGVGIGVTGRPGGAEGVAGASPGPAGIGVGDSGGAPDPGVVGSVEVEGDAGVVGSADDGFAGGTAPGETGVGGDSVGSAGGPGGARGGVEGEEGFGPSAVVPGIKDGEGAGGVFTWASGALEAGAGLLDRNGGNVGPVGAAPVGAAPVVELLAGDAGAGEPFPEPGDVIGATGGVLPGTVCGTNEGSVPLVGRIGDAAAAGVDLSFFD